MTRRRRYDRIGPVYDVVSLERLLYGRPRARLLELLAPSPGATVVDLGCGTGLNLPYLSNAVGPHGRVYGIDASSSMLTRARRRVDGSGAANVHLIHGEVADLLDLLARNGVDERLVDVVVATHLLSLLDDDQPVWSAIVALGAQHPVRVGIADVGDASSAARPVRATFALLATIGGADPHRRPWQRLAREGTLEIHEQYLAGHVHIAVGTRAPRPS